MDPNEPARVQLLIELLRMNRKIEATTGPNMFPHK
jgi:hypothetical protein